MYFSTKIEVAMNENIFSKVYFIMFLGIKDCIQSFEYANTASRNHTVESYPILISSILQVISKNWQNLEGKQVAILWNPLSFVKESKI